MYTKKGQIKKIFLCRTPNPDVNIALVGKIYYNDTSILENKIKATYSDIKQISIDGVMLTGDSKDMQESAMLQKVMVLFAVGDIDVFYFR